MTCGDRAGDKTVATDASGPSPSATAGTWWKSAFRWGVSIGLIVILVLAVDVASVLNILGAAHFGLFTGAVVLAVMDRLLMIGKWYPLLGFQVGGVSPMRAAKAYMAASFASLALPSSVGGDIIRAWGLGKACTRIAEVGASILVERLLGLAGLCLVIVAILGVAVGRTGELPEVLPWAGVLALVALAALVAPFILRDSPLLPPLLRWLKRFKWGRGIGRFTVAFSKYARRPKLLLTVGGLSVVEQLFPIAIVWVLSLALKTSAEASTLIIVTPLAVFITRLPISVDGIGIMESAFVFLLGAFGVPADEALALAVAKRIVTTLVILPGAVWLPNIDRDATAETPGTRGPS